MKKLLILTVVGLGISFCSNDPALSPEYSSGWQPPVVKGMEITNEQGLVIDVWGNPDFPKNVKDPADFPKDVTGPETLLFMYSPYPNPAEIDFTIGFEISRPANVKAWVSPARWANEPAAGYPAVLGGTVIDAGGTRAVEVLLDGSNELLPGVYQTVFENRSEDGERQVPQGFYRVYIQANGVTLWRDIYVRYNCEESPAGLPRNSYSCYN